MDIAFIGAGIMGHGMACNLLSAGHKVAVIAHKNRAPIEDLISRGAEEATSYKELITGKVAVFICVTNSMIAEEVIDQIGPFLKEKALVIDTTTNEPEAPIRLAAKVMVAGGRYVEAPITGGVTQAANGVLGAIVACDEQDFLEAKELLSACCKQVEHFGSIGMAAKTKLVSNFLALGTATLVVETFNHARSLGVDWRKLYELAQLGSGNSSAMHRIIGNALEGDNKGYVFTNDNTLKDLSYIQKLLEDEQLDVRLAATMKSIYENTVQQGDGGRMISERLTTSDEE
jgi:3-hydroxyisobutyrate dehydrogenase-like beta-hydroxyacid dehydrogenase